MTRLGETVSAITVRKLEERTVRLAALVDAATQSSAHKLIRARGAQLIERLTEWMEEIKDQRAAGDEEVREKVESFHARLYLAERKVKDWAIPDHLFELAADITKPKRRGRPRKKQGRQAA